MKKIILSFFLISLNTITAQLNKITVELDNSNKYLYEIEYSKAKIDATKKKTADKLKNHAESILSDLQQNTDYLLKNGANYTRLNNEVLRLKNYVYDIYNLLPLLNDNKLDESKMISTVNKAYDQYHESLKSGELKRIGTESMIVKALDTYSDADVLNVAVFKSGQSKEQLLVNYKNSGSEMTLINYLKNIIKNSVLKE